MLPDEGETSDVTEQPDPQPEEPQQPEQPTDEPQEGEDGEGDEQQPLRDERGRYKGGAQGRINELTRARHDAERRAQAAEAELAKFKGNATPDGASPGTAAKPSPNDFDDYGDYVEALIDWKVGQSRAESAKAAATEAATHAENARIAEWQAKVADAAPSLPDWDTVVGKSEIQVAPHLANAIMDADRGVELAYHMAKNPALVEQLNAMSPYRAAMELGRLEASLGGQAPAQRQSSAPPPISPVKQGATTTKDPSKMSMDEYQAWRRKNMG